MSRRASPLTPEDLLLHTWNLVHRARGFPAVQAPLMTALQEIAKALRPAEAAREDPSVVAKTGSQPASDLLAA